MIEGHGDDLYKYERPVKVNFSSNLTNWIDPAPLRTFLSERVGEALSVYPEPSPFTLEARLARLLRLSPDNICVTSGATEAIYLVAQSYARSRSAVMQPTFSEYADACRIHGHRVSSLYQWPAHGHLPADVRMVWLCNPNNPTGGVWEKDFLLAQIQKNPDVLFVIDQSYEAFTLAPLFSAREASEMPNVLLLHSLTKRYAMPGLRLGYLTGPVPLVAHLRTHRMPWSVNGVALAAGMFLAEHPEALPFDLPGCLAEKERFVSRLRAAGGWDVWDSDTHFFLVRLRMGCASALKDYLMREHGLLIRDASNFEGLDSAFFRVSTQRAEDNDLLVEALIRWMED